MDSGISSQVGHSSLVSPVSLLLDTDLLFHGKSFDIFLVLQISPKRRQIEPTLLLLSQGFVNLPSNGATGNVIRIALTYILKVTNFKM